MTFRQFLDTAYTLLVENLIASGMRLPKALEEMADFAARTMPDEPRVLERGWERKNDAALRQFSARLAKVGHA